MEFINRIAIIGSGRVAHHLAKAFKSSGDRIVNVYSRNFKHAENLAKKVDANPLLNVDDLDPNLDLLIFAVSDDSLSDDLFKKFPKNITAVHTSGSVSIDVLNYFDNNGVFYPLQSFTKKRKLDFNKIPICIESKSKKTEAILRLLANDISDNVHFLNSEERKHLHLAAVFASNFTNYMYKISFEILANSNIDKSILQPLIEETALRLRETDATEMQTGPAIRGDENILDKHMELLSFNSDYQELYSYISKLIFKEHNEEL
jgi:predicted short-subunit dehydrogenase-like oxidoreductase (DUF2520 family)